MRLILIWLPVSLAILLSFVFSPTVNDFKDFIGQVVGVADGDSLKVMHEGKVIRLNGSDCPEKRQLFGTRAKEYTSAFGQKVTVIERGRDRYGRTLAIVILPDGRNLTHQPLKTGPAWWFRKYLRALRLEELERRVRHRSMGALLKHPEVRQKSGRRS